jgi:hypothetical protein
MFLSGSIMSADGYFILSRPISFLTQDRFMVSCKGTVCEPRQRPPSDGFARNLVRTSYD